jgi:hypothetical protein
MPDRNDNCRADDGSDDCNHEGRQRAARDVMSARGTLALRPPTHSRPTVCLPAALRRNASSLPDCCHMFPLPLLYMRVTRTHLTVLSKEVGSRQTLYRSLRAAFLRFSGDKAEIPLPPLTY